MKSTEGNPARLQEALGDKYQVLRWIGGGGMAQVYLARHRTTGGLFAVKVLAEHLSAEDGVIARFLQEARTSASLSGHPNIVSIFDVGDFEEVHYILMQYVDGEDLKGYLARRGKLPPEEAARIAEQIAEALAFAHSRMVVHRDMKPSNVKVQNSGRVVVLDFGIAKAGDAPTQLTLAGQRVGTPDYMSPEHFATGACDARSDLYSLGVVFFEMLTGSRPFGGESIQDIQAAHMGRPAPSPCAWEATVPEAYGRIVLRLLEKRPENRYQSAAELIADIKALSGTPMTAAPAAPRVEPAPTPSAPAPAAPRPKRARLAAFSLAGLAVAASATGLYFWMVQQRPAPDPVVRQGAANDAGGAAAISVDSKPVANTEFKAFCDQTGHPYPAPPPSDRDYFFAKPEAPVLNVTYNDAISYAAWAGKRLPSAAEWDKAVGSAPIGEWTSTPFLPVPADAAAFEKLSGGRASGEWQEVRGVPQLRGLPSESRPGAIPVGFRCVKEAKR